MSKRSVFLIMMTVPDFLFAQFGYFSVGYNGNLLQSENLDYVIDRYNETRTYLSEPMAYPHYLDGFDLHLGGGDKFLIDAGYSWRSSFVSATGTDATGTNQQRDLKYKCGAFDFALGYNLVRENITLSIGYNQTIGSEKIFSRVGTIGDVGDTEYGIIFKSFNPGADLFLQFILPFSEQSGLIIKPYFHFSYGDTDYADVNYSLNPNTAPFDDQVLESRLNGFGISAMLGFGQF